QLGSTHINEVVTTALIDRDFQKFGAVAPGDGVKVAGKRITLTYDQVEQSECIGGQGVDFFVQHRSGRRTVEQRDFDMDGLIGKQTTRFITSYRLVIDPLRDGLGMRLESG